MAAQQPNALTVALAIMWTKAHTLPKEPDGCALLTAAWRSNFPEEEGMAPLEIRRRILSRGLCPEALKCNDNHLKYIRKNRNQFNGSNACTTCGRLFRRTTTQYVTRCPDCRAGKKPAPVWGDLAKVLKKSERARAISRRPERVSQPIEACSDVGALFELLSQVGGRMPEGGDR